MATASAVIAAELAERIRSGRLRPGDRLPSAREITRRWGVALATASRVHALLRADGLAVSVPGAGTVVATSAAGSATPPPARRTRQAAAGATAPDRTTSLSPDRIVAAAVAIADREGLEGLSMRRVAVALGTAPMSLYRHVTDKDELLLRMTEQVWQEWQPAATSTGWRERILASERALWHLLQRHPWLAATLSVTRPQMIAAGLPYTEWGLRALVEQGLSPAEAFGIHLTLFTYVRGVGVLLEPEAEAEAATGVGADAWVEQQRHWLQTQASQGQLTAFTQLLESGYDFDLDALFDQGLVMLVDGIDRRIQAPHGS